MILSGIALHPSIQKAVKLIDPEESVSSLDAKENRPKSLLEQLVEGQGWLNDSSHWKMVLDLIPDEGNLEMLLRRKCLTSSCFRDATEN